MTLANLILLSNLLLLSLSLSAQSVGISEDPNAMIAPTAMLDVQSTTKGVLFPRLTTSQRTTLGMANPQNGTLVFDSDKNSYWYWVNGKWVELAETGNNSGVISGTIVAFAGPSTRIPTGWLLCDGSAVSRIQYKDLFDAITIYWGIGDGVNTFNLPDLRGTFLRGVSYASSNDPDKNNRMVSFISNPSNEVGSSQSTATARPNTIFSGTTNSDGAHTHLIARITDGIVPLTGELNQPSEVLATIKGSQTPGSSHIGDGEVVYALNGVDGSHNAGVTSTAPNHTHNFSISKGGDTETRPQNAYVNYIIKY